MGKSRGPIRRQICQPEYRRLKLGDVGTNLQDRRFGILSVRRQVKHVLSQRTFTFADGN